MCPWVQSSARADGNRQPLVPTLTPRSGRDRDRAARAQQGVAAAQDLSESVDQARQVPVGQVAPVPFIGIPVR